MPLPLDTNALPPDLAARFAALRTPSSSQTSTSTHQSNETLEDRLKRLEPPSEQEVEIGVPIQVNQEGDEAVARFLSLSNSSPPTSEPPLSLPSPSRQRLPSLSPNTLDHLSGVEIQFMRPSLGVSSGEISSNFAGDDDLEESDLIKRMRDELSVETSTQKRSEAGVDEWEERLEGLKGVVGGRPKRWEEDERIARELGDAPELGDLERALRRRKKREKKGGSEEESDETSESEEETDSEKDSEEDE